MVKGTETSSQEVKYLPFYAVDDYNRYSNNIYIGTKDTIIFGLPETKNINIIKRSFTDLAEFLKGDYTQMAKFTSKDITILLPILRTILLPILRTILLPILRTILCLS